MGDLGELGAGGDVDDEGVPGGALLGFEDFGDTACGVEGVGAEAVDGFGGERDGVAGAEEVGGAGDVERVVGVEALSGHVLMVVDGQPEAKATTPRFAKDRGESRITVGLCTGVGAILAACRVPRLN